MVLPPSMAPGLPHQDTWAGPAPSVHGKNFVGQPALLPMGATVAGGKERGWPSALLTGFPNRPFVH